MAEQVFDKVYQQWVPKDKAVAPISNCVKKKPNVKRP